jgi:maltose alpha-D-glucosyltransferase/alpha-amylase
MGTDWLADAVLYEIYPQSFADSNGDGVGDLRGVIGRLDHIASLGVNTVWFNPFFTSPFVDAGYDVADYLTVAPRYGTNDDLVELVAAARDRGIRVILDLVAGHTSIEHPWFQQELHAEGPDAEGDRYVWCEDLPERVWSLDIPGTPGWVASPGPRRGWYLKNFYDEQPALNFGWTRRDGASWRDLVDDPGPLRNRRALLDILDFWLGRGVAGFRVDMAFSLVKDDRDPQQGIAASTGVWREIRQWLDVAHPDAVLIPEGQEPRTGAPLAFDGDFFLVIMEEHTSLFDNHAAGILPFQPPREPFFDADGRGSTRVFLDGWASAKQVDPGRVVIMSTADHDFDRLCCGPRTPEQLGAAFTFLLTWGTVPCIYYGDEIGMRYLPGLPDVEGAVCNPAYNRAGCRTPMQWDDGPNAGFSTADPSRLYLPVDPDPGRPTVLTNEADPSSVLNLVRRLVALRTAVPQLGSRASTEVLNEGYPFTFVRGGTHLVAVNPRREPAELQVPDVGSARVLLGHGISVADDQLTVDGFGYAVLALRAVTPSDADRRRAGWPG